jgi:hypothetical protein
MGKGFDWGNYLMMSMMQSQAQQTAADNAADRAFGQGLINDARVRADAAEKRLADQAAERKAGGIAGKSTYIANVKTRLEQGLIGEETAQKLIEDYNTKYDLAPDVNDYTGVTEAYSKFAPKKREVELSSAYQRLLGRSIKADELTAGQSQLALGRTIGDIEKDIEATSEYKKARPGSAFEAEQETRYGGPVLDATGARTGKYKFNFGTGTLPQLSADLTSKTGITAPGFIGKEFTGSAEEIADARDSKNNYETYMYNSGLKSLEGNIQTELTKLQTEGQIKVGKQQEQYGLLKGLVGAFSF